MKLLDNGKDVPIGSFISDDFGNDWFVVGFDSEIVQMIPAKKFWNSVTNFPLYAMDLEVQN